MKKTLFECEIECVVDDALEGVLKPEQNSVPLKASFFLEDVYMWKETGDADYPCRVYVAQWGSYGLWKISYREFTEVMKVFLRKSS